MLTLQILTPKEFFNPLYFKNQIQEDEFATLAQSAQKLGLSARDIGIITPQGEKIQIDSINIESNHAKKLYFESFAKIVTKDL